jgi:hypothetical protein
MVYKLSDSFKTILQNNVRGIVKDGEMEECVLMLKKSKAWVGTLQETWIVGNSVVEHDDWFFIHHGPKEKLCRRGSLGVSIALSKDAKKAWEQAGCTQMYFGLRILATRLKVLSKQGKTVMDIYLVSAYAPDSGKSQEERDEFNTNLQKCIDNCSQRGVGYGN